MLLVKAGACSSCRASFMRLPVSAPTRRRDLSMSNGSTFLMDDSVFYWLVDESFDVTPPAKKLTLAGGFKFGSCFSSINALFGSSCVSSSCALASGNFSGSSELDVFSLACNFLPWTSMLVETERNLSLSYSSMFLMLEGCCSKLRKAAEIPMRFDDLLRRDLLLMDSSARI